MKKILILTISSLLSLNAWANCEALNGSQFAQCLDKELNKSKEELKVILNQTYAELPSTSKEAFNASQKAWLNYRKLECDFQLSLNSTASNFPNDADSDLSICITAMNKERISYIKNH